MTATEVFLDTAYAIALSSPKDEHHDKAVELAEQLESSGIKRITTRPVALEIGNALARQRYREAPVALLQSLEKDPNVEIVPLTEELYARGFELYRNRSDKEWRITDCISFVIMRERGLNEAPRGNDGGKRIEADVGARFIAPDLTKCKLIAVRRRAQ